MHGELARPVARVDQLSYYPQLVERLPALHQEGLSAAQIAARLNAEGYRPPKRIPQFSPAAVTTLLRRLRDDAPPRAHAPSEGLGEHEWLLSDLARHLHMPETTLYTWIRRGWVTARRHGTPPRWIIKADPADVAELRQRRSRPPATTPACAGPIPLPPTPKDPALMPPHIYECTAVDTSPLPTARDTG
jgi:hypothetical protein